MATSLSDDLDRLHSPLDVVRSARALETAGGVAIGFVVAAGLTYFFQHFVLIQRGTVRGRVLEWCGTGVSPLAGAQVVAAGQAGASAGGTYVAAMHGDGTYELSVPPGVLLLGVIDSSGRQSPSVLLTPKTASNELPLTSAFELVYDVPPQVIVPPGGAVTADLAVNC